MNIPEGWQLVPIEPTEVMCRAAEESEHGSNSKPWLDGMHTPENVEMLYKTMLAAAPTPPAPEAEPVGYVELAKLEAFREKCLDYLIIFPPKFRTGHETVPVFAHQPPINDGLRKAAAWAVKEYLTAGGLVGLAMENLRAELDKGKS